MALLRGGNSFISYENGRASKTRLSVQCDKPKREALRILSIASGSLREVELSEAFNSGTVQEWAAVDQDEESLLECNRFYGVSGVSSLKGSVRQLLSRKLSLGQFDFVYAAGLFDYLGVPIAEALVYRMFKMLKPTGYFTVVRASAEEKIRPLCKTEE